MDLQVRESCKAGLLQSAVLLRPRISEIRPPAETFSSFSSTLIRTFLRVDICPWRIQFGGYLVIEILDRVDPKVPRSGVASEHESGRTARNRRPAYTPERILRHHAPPYHYDAPHIPAKHIHTLE